MPSLDLNSGVNFDLNSDPRFMPSLDLNFDLNSDPRFGPELRPELACELVPDIYAELGGEVCLI
jgi:hypothetical protein